MKKNAPAFTPARFYFHSDGKESNQLRAGRQRES